MCLIIYAPESATPIPDEWIDSGWQANSHGAGYMFATGGKLVVRKPFYKLKELKEAYATDHKQYGKVSAFVMHFRWSTHGTREVENVHPHILAGGDVGLVHNGILSDFTPPYKSEMSDTAFFCSTVLMGRTPLQLLSEEFAKSLEDMIGTGNKLVLMDSDGNVTIPNLSQGVWDGNCWLSNASYLPSPGTKWVNKTWTPSVVSDIARGMSFGEWRKEDYNEYPEEEDGAKLPMAYQKDIPSYDDGADDECREVIEDIEDLLFARLEDLTPAQEHRLSDLVDWWMEQEALESEVDQRWESYRKMEQDADNLFANAMAKEA
jgi:hypothetical protein